MIRPPEANSSREANRNVSSGAFVAVQLADPSAWVYRVYPSEYWKADSTEAVSMDSEKTIWIAASVAAVPPGAGDVESTRGGVVSGAGNAVSKDHTRQSQNPGGPIAQGSPPTPFPFWSSRFPEGSRAVVSNVTVYRVAGWRVTAGTKADVLRTGSWVHVPSEYTTTPSVYENDAGMEVQSILSLHATRMPVSTGTPVPVGPHPIARGGIVSAPTESAPITRAPRTNAMTSGTSRDTMGHLTNRFILSWRPYK